METEITADYLKKHNFSIDTFDGRNKIASRKIVGGTITFGMCTISTSENGYKDINYCEIYYKYNIYPSLKYHGNYKMDNDQLYFKGYLNNIDQVLLILKGMGYTGPDIFRLSGKELEKYELELEKYKSNYIVIDTIVNQIKENLYYCGFIDLDYNIFCLNKKEPFKIYYKESSKTHLIVVDIDENSIKHKNRKIIDELITKAQNKLTGFIENQEKYLKIDFKDHSVIAMLSSLIPNNILDKYEFIHKIDLI